MQVQHLTAGVLALGALALAACSPTPSKAPDKAAEASAPATPAAPKLPVSINAVMVGMVDYAAEPVWKSGYKPPKTAAGWRDLEHNAYEVAVNGKLIQLVGTGPNDAKWAADPEWIRLADAESAAGMDVLKAAQAKDVAGVNAAGDKLVAVCEDCHKKFKPAETTGGLYKSPDYPGK